MDESGQAQPRMPSAEELRVALQVIMPAKDPQHTTLGNVRAETWRAIWVESLSARGHNKRWFARPFSAGRMHKGIHSCGKQAPAASDQASREMYKLDWEPRQKVWQGGGR